MFFLVQLKAGAIGIRVHSTKNSLLKCVGCEPEWVVGRGPSICLDFTPVSTFPDVVGNGCLLLTYKFLQLMLVMAHVGLPVL